MHRRSLFRKLGAAAAVVAVAPALNVQSPLVDLTPKDSPWGPTFSTRQIRELERQHSLGLMTRAEFERDVLGGPIYASDANQLLPVPIGKVGQVLTIRNGVRAWEDPAATD